MVGWISIVRDKVFVGFGPPLECSHCHNERCQEVWQSYTQQFGYSLIPMPRIYSSFFVRCPICHWGFEVWKRDRKHIAELLEGGKEATKSAFAKMPQKDKSRLLKHLNRNGFTQISRILAFSEPIVS